MFYPASALRAEREVDPRDEDFGIQDRRVGSVAYLGVPGFGGGSPARLRAYAQDLRGRIERQHRASPCGWIVDLRGNGGGNMHPMIAGLEPFLGHQTLGYTVERKSREAWSGLGYYERIGERRPERLEPDLTSAPVAVLVGSQTASSGEIVAIAFRGRAKARSYGTPTAGASSANLRVDLSDGSALFVTAALNADRTGKLIEGALVPDVRTAPADASPSTIPGAAIEWLESVGGCRR
jgi:C-terminal processing protease CtpA/Prc